MAALQVLVSRHARDRALERCGVGVSLVAFEVGDAVTAGRVSVHEPVWAGRYGRRRADRTKSGAIRGHVRWAWNLDETRAYLISRKGGRWIVVTVIAADTADRAAA